MIYFIIWYIFGLLVMLYLVKQTGEVTVEDLLLSTMMAIIMPAFVIWFALSFVLSYFYEGFIKIKDTPVWKQK